MENLGILYFSSTGNSLYIAKKIQEKFGGSVAYIPKYSGNGGEFNKIILVTPIYSFGMPLPVYDLLPRLNKKAELFVVLNYGGMMGGADRLIYEYAVKCGLNVKTVVAMKMPENFTLVMSPPKFYKKMILNGADKKINKIIADLQEDSYKIPKAKRTKEATYLKNKSNWHEIGNRFSTNDKCVSCGKCISLCPVGNISLSDGKIVFADKCIACLGCFHRCPNNAIIYQNKDNKKRYVNPNVSESDIGKDF